MATLQELADKYNQEAAQAAASGGVAPAAPASQFKGASGLAGFALDILPFGRIAEKALTGNAGKITAGETALEAALTALPFLRLGKGAKAGISLAKPAEKGAVNVAQKAGSRMTQFGSGIKVAPEVGGINKARQLATTASQFSGTPRKQLDKIATEMATKGQQVEALLGVKKYAIAPSKITSVANKFASDPNKLVLVDLTDVTVKKNFNSHLTNMRKAGDALGVNNYVKKLNSVAQKAQSKIDRGLIPTAKEQAALAAKQVGDDVVSTAVPAVKPLKREMAKLFELNPMVTKASEKNLYIPIVGTPVPGVLQGLRGASSVAGKSLSKTGAAYSELPTAQRVLLAQAGIRLPKALLAPGGGEPTPEELATATEAGVAPDQLQAVIDQIASGEALGQTQQQPTVEDILPFRNLQAAIAADPKNATKYISAYTSLSKIIGDRLSVSAAREKTMMGTQAASGLVNQIEQTLGQVGASGRIGGGLAKVQGALGLNARANAYEQSRPSLALMLIKAIQGSAGNISDADRAAIENAIPSVMDTNEERALKVQSLRSIVNTYSSAASGNQPSSNSNSALLEALQAASMQ